MTEPFYCKITIPTSFSNQQTSRYYYNYIQKLVGTVKSVILTDREDNKPKKGKKQGNKLFRKGQDRATREQSFPRKFQ